MPLIQKYKWILRKSDIGLCARDCGMGFEFNGRLWLSNGYTPGNIPIRDLAVSHNGFNWSVLNNATPYQPYAAICPLGDFVFVYDGIMRRTTNGVAFQTVNTTNNPPFEPEAPMFEVGGKLHIIRTGFTDTFDPDTGLFSTVPAPATSTKGHARIAFGGKIFVIGGADPVANNPAESGYPGMTSLNSVWESATPEDPLSWTKSFAPFIPRMWPGVGVHDGHLYVTGGYDNFVGGTNSLTNRNDTFRTKDGISWERVETTEDYTSRHAPTLYSRNGRLILVCGNTNMNGSIQRDAWELIPA